MTAEDLIFILRHLDPREKIYIAITIKEKKQEARSVYRDRGKYVILAVEEP